MTTPTVGGARFIAARMDGVERGRAYAVTLGASVRDAFGAASGDGGGDGARESKRRRAEGDDVEGDDDGDGGAPVTVFRYDFMSDDADRTRPARVTCAPNGAVEVTFASKARASEGGTVRYRGAHRARAARRNDVEDGEAATEGASDDRGVDCALIFDRKTQIFVLERVAGVVGNLRIAREDARSVGAGVLGDGELDVLDGVEDDGGDDGAVGDVAGVEAAADDDASAMFPSSKKE